MANIREIIERLDRDDLTRDDIDTLRDYLNTRFNDLIPKIPPGYKVFRGLGYTILAQTKRQAQQLLLKGGAGRFTGKKFNSYFSDGTDFWVESDGDCPQVPTIVSKGIRITL